MDDLKNYMEICVTDMLDTIMNELECCTCNKCKLDILAISLNNLPTKYVVTRKGELYTKISTLQQQLDVDIISAITQAANIVNANPRHE